MKKIITPLKLIAILTFAVMSQTALAQDVQENQKALSLIKNNAAAIGLSPQDIADSRITDTYVDALTGNTLVYVQQTYQGIDVDKMIQVLAFKNGKLVSVSGKRFDLFFGKFPVTTQQRKAAVSSIGPQAAIQAAAQHLNLSMPSLPKRRYATDQDFSKSINFGDMGIAKKNVTARQLWIPQKSFEKIKLVWEVNLSPKKSTDNWRIIVDATTGSVIKKENYTRYDTWYKIEKEDETLGQPYNDTSLKRKVIIKMIIKMIIKKMKRMIMEIMIKIIAHRLATALFPSRWKRQIFKSMQLNWFLIPGGYHPMAVAPLLLYGIVTDQSDINLPVEIMFWHRKM